MTSDSRFVLQVATRPWSPNQGKAREMTKLCNHKRKIQPIQPQPQQTTVQQTAAVQAALGSNQQQIVPANQATITSIPLSAGSPQLSEKSKGTCTILCFCFLFIYCGQCGIECYRLPIFFFVNYGIVSDESAFL